MRRRGDPLRTAQLNIRVPPQLKEDALRASEALERSLTGLIEGFLEDLVKRTRIANTKREGTHF